MTSGATRKPQKYIFSRIITELKTCTVALVGAMLVQTPNVVDIDIVNTISMAKKIRKFDTAASSPTKAYIIVPKVSTSETACGTNAIVLPKTKLITG
mmetsp:Transcript_60004/g.177922  ORF Transcript_60004/g.177922 Transcript_60004/m.177922 type:complete len:97 (+) Transcript_60004:2273-2563(+)